MCPLVADDFGAEGPHERGGGAHLVDAEEPPDVAPREGLPVDRAARAGGWRRGWPGATGEWQPARSSTAGGRWAGWRRDGRVRAGGEGRDVDPPRDAPVAPAWAVVGPGSRATNRITAEDRPQADDRVRIGFAAVAAEVNGSEQAPDLPKADRVDETASHLRQRLRADPDRVCRPNLASTGRLPARPARGFRPPRVISGSTALVPSVLGG